MAKKKNNRKWIILGLIVVVALLAMAAYFQNASKPKGIEVEVAKSEIKTIRESVSASGRIYPEVEVIISSDVSGEIVDLYVEEGDSVAAGQLLLKIDPEAYLSSVDRGAADLNNAKAQLARSRAEIETNRADLEANKVALIQARRKHSRNEGLFKEGVISQAEFDDSLAEVESAQAGIRSSEARIKSAEESAIGAQYSVQSSDATLKELRTNLSRTRIKAPSSGIVTSLSVEKGERVVGTAQMAGTEIMRISNLSTMEVQVEVSENDILKVALNDEVEIEVDAYIDRKFLGRVTEIANSATNVAGTTSATAQLNTDQVTNFIVKIRIDPSSYQDLSDSDESFAFRPGMSASVSIITDVQKDILAVPIQAVAVRVLDEDSDDDEYKEVLFLYQADTANMVEVSTGIQDDEFIQILSGIEADMDVISAPYSALSKELEEGSELRIKVDDEDSKGRKKARGALIIFIKNPVKGTVKTRLAQDVGDDRALEIYQKLLTHTRNVALELEDVDRYLYYLDDVQQDDWSSDHFIKKLQAPGDLGDKMLQSFSEVLSNTDHAVIIGSDCAQLTSDVIRTAFQSLEKKDIVIGPTYDGGYYLIGMSEAHSFLFENMAWSMPDVFAITMERIKNANKTCQKTLKLSDIDYIEDWEKYGLDP